MTPPSKTSRQRKPTVPNPKAALEVDHRKRPRNRTTQSCLNCHTSKRMCDRKRPACSRCVQLGLTGLCAYEVDDPNQKTLTDGDESVRLFKRIAELEEVIRELKNKPHPRWLQGSIFAKPSGLEVRTSGLESETGSYLIPNSSSLPGSSPSSESGNMDISSRLGMPGVLPSDLLNFSASPASISPTNEDAIPDFPFGISAYGPIQEYSVTSVLQSPMFGGLNANSACKQLLGAHRSLGHCGCLQDPTSYQTMLELSLRLRKATDVLGQSPTHRGEGFCQLHQRILELDLFAM